MLIKNIQFDANKHYRCSGKTAQYLFDKGFSEIGREDGKVIFTNTPELQEALKKMSFCLKFITKLGGDSR